MTLGKALETGGVALAKVVNDQSVQRMEKALDERQRLLDEVEELRGQWKWWHDLFTNQEKMQATLDRLRRKAEAKKAELDALPHYPTLREHAGKNEQDCLDAILLIVAWLNEQLNIQGMTKPQMQTLAVDILGAYGSLRLEDLLIAFRSALRGDYGTIYNRLDIAVVHEWLAKYKAALDGERAGKADGKRASAKGEARHKKI